MDNWYSGRKANHGDCKYMCERDKRFKGKCKCFSFTKSGGSTCKIYTQKATHCAQCSKVGKRGAHNDKQGEKQPKGHAPNSVKHWKGFPKSGWARNTILAGCSLVSNARRRNNGQFHWNQCTQCKPGYGFSYRTYNNDGMIGGCRPYETLPNLDCYNLDKPPNWPDKSGPSDNNKICTKATKVRQVIAPSRDKHAKVRNWFRNVKGYDNSAVATCLVW